MLEQKSKEEVRRLKKELKVKEQRLKKSEQELAYLQGSYGRLNLKAEILQVVSRAINSAYFDLGKLLEFIMDLGLRVVRVEAGSLLLLDEESKELRFSVAKGERGDQVKKFKLKLGEGIAGWVAKTGKPEVVLDVNKSPHFKREISRLIGFPTYSVLCVPLKVRKKIIGVIEMINKKGKKPFSKEDKELLTVLANQAAIALENAELFRKAEEKIRDLTTLSEVSTLIASSLDENIVLENIMNLTTQLMKAEGSSLMLINEKTGNLEFVVTKGEKKEEVKKVKLKLGEGIAGWVAKEGQPLLIPDAYKDPRFSPKVDKDTGFKTKSILCVPLEVKDKVIGVAEVLNRLDGKPFEERDVELFSSFANQMAVAIENAKLYRDLRELFLSTVKSLAAAIDAKSPYTRKHSEKVAEYALAIAKELKLSSEEQEIVHLSGLLHDVGKIGIDEKLLNKQGRLTDEEYAQIKEHPAIGAEIIEPIGPLKAIIPGVRSHQERYDGRGYPDGLAGEKIPLTARILAVADTFDAMTSDRPYRDKFADEIAQREIENCAGTQFDPQVARAFLRAYKKGEIVKKYVING